MDLYNEAQSIVSNYKILTTVIAGSGLLLSAYAIKSLTAKKHKLPPGPRPWPIVGNLLDFNNNPQTLQLFENYRMTYGNIFTFYVGTTALVALNGYELIKEAFITKGDDFAGSFELVSNGGRSILTGQFEPVWQVQRKILHGALRQYATGKHLEEKVHDAFNITCKNMLHRIDEGPLNPVLTMSLLVYNIIYSIAFGKTYEQDDDEFKMVVEKIDSVNGLVGNGLLADYIPCLRYLPTPAVNKIKREMNFIQTFVRKQWNNHISTYDQSNISDLTFHIVKLREELKGSDEDSGALSQLSEEHYLEIISDVITAGTNTSRYTMVWVILYWAAHPDIQSRMQEEIDSTIGSRVMKLADRQSLPYTNAVLHEVMRLRPFAPMLLPRTTTCVTSVGGYTLPTKTVVLANVMSLHMDPTLFPEPGTFKPERFLDDHSRFQSRPGEWMPFSTGRRVCVGESIAKVQLHLLTAMLFQKFSFFPVAGKDIDLTSQDLTLFMLPKDQKVSIKPRH